MKLPGSFDIESPIQLEPSCQYGVSSDEVFALGWGQNLYFVNGKALLRANFKILAHKKCLINSYLAQELEICVGCAEKRMARRGDSGGPIINMVNNKPTLISVMVRAQQHDFKPFFTAIVYYYRQWIYKTIKSMESPHYDPKNEKTKIDNELQYLAIQQHKTNIENNKYQDMFSF